MSRRFLKVKKQIRVQGSYVAVKARDLSDRSWFSAKQVILG